MKISNIKHLLLSSFMLVLLTLMVGTPAYAQEGEGGGAVQTNGVIGFYEEDAPPASSSTEPIGSSSEPAVTKPAGKYPSTGELVRKSLSISGAILVLCVLVLFLIKRRKRGTES